MQSNRKHISVSPSTIAVTRHILCKQGFGLNGLNKGLSATIMRNAIFNSFYFGIYNSIIPWLNKKNEYTSELFLKVYSNILYNQIYEIKIIIKIYIYIENL